MCQQEEVAVIGLSFSWCTGDLRGTGVKTEVGKVKQDASKCWPMFMSSAKKETESLLQDMRGPLGLEEKISDS